MRIVSAGVHPSRVLRGVVDAGLLGDRQRVDVGAERHVAARLRTAQQSHHIGPEQGREELQTESGDPFPDQPGGFKLLARQLRNLVEPVPELHYAREDVGELLHNSSKTIFPPTMVPQTRHCTSQPSKGVLRELERNFDASIR